jgi:hemoglobin/transferrin/lactoferrin receptor protein
VVLQDGATQYYEQYRMGSFFSDPNLFCNVEVLRGPASATLYGSAAIGGVIRFETCDADDLLTEGQDGQLRLSLGGETNGEGGDASVRYATRLDENVDLFFNFNYRQADDYEDGDGTVIPGSAFEALSGVASLTYNFSGSRSLRLIYERWESDLAETQYSQTGQFRFGTIDRATTDQTVSAIFESAEAFGDLEVTLAYADTDVVQENASAAAFSGSVLFEDADYGYATLSLDARVTEEVTIGGIDTTLIYGATISRQDREAEADTSTFIPFHPEGTATRMAVFAQGELDFGNGLTLVPGLRLEWARNEPGADNPGRTEDSQETTEILAISPKIAFTYDVSDRLGVFGSIAQTQRAPTLDELYSYEVFGRSSFFAEAAVDLDPETARTVELGFTYSTTGILTPDDAFDARVTTHYSFIEDLIQLAGAPGSTAYVNVDEAEIYGIEIEAAYVSEAWYGNLAISAIEGRNLTEDEVWSQLPQDSLNLTVGRRDAASGVGFGWTMNAFADLDHGDGERFPGYATHDLFASYAPPEGPLEGFEFRFGVDNVFDRTYRNALDQENGRGRTARLTLARVWDF